MSEKKFTSKTKDKLPPQNLEAEQSVLGCLMLDKDAVIKIADILKPDDFYRSAHRQIYEAMLRLFDKNEPIDFLTLTNLLQKENKLEELGGNSYLTELINIVPTASYVAHYAKIVKSKKILRDLINASQEIGEISFGEPEDIDQLLDRAEEKIFAISQNSVSQKYTSIKDGLTQAIERINSIKDEKRLRGISSGFEGLDNYLSGFQNSDMVVVAARPSLGKTTLALDFARSAAISEKKPVAIFSLEMAKEQLIDRFLAAEAGINLWQMRTGALPEADHVRIAEAADKLRNAPIFIDDTSSPTVMQIKTIGRRIQAEHGLGLIVIDYIQLIQPRNNFESTVQQYTEISRNIKALARELNVPVLALSQLNRSVESRTPAKPKLSDLRETGSWEQDSDVVLMIYRKDRDSSLSQNEDENGSGGPARIPASIIIAKHRNGPVGEVELIFNKEHVSFETPPAEQYR